MQPTTANAKVRIVVIDDDRDAREPFAEFLRMSGFGVDEFEDPQEALDAIAGEMPAVVLIDITLSGEIDGYEAARSIRALPAAAAVRLVAVTGYSAKVVEQQGALFDAILTKPIDADELVAVVKRLTG